MQALMLTIRPTVLVPIFGGFAEEGGGEPEGDGDGDGFAAFLYWSEDLYTDWR